MSAADREHLRRDCSDALKAVQEDRNDVARLRPLAVALVKLGPSYRVHRTLMQAALMERKDVTVIGT